MRFNIRFINYIQSVSVAQFVPALHVRVVTGAHGIDIGLFKQANIRHHLLLGYGFSATVVKLMAVNTGDFDGLTVDQQLPVADFNGFETDVIGFMIHGIASRINKAYDTAIQRWSFCGPRTRLRNPRRNNRKHIATCINRRWMT